jgi:predicted ester cyclase
LSGSWRPSRAGTPTPSRLYTPNRRFCTTRSSRSRRRATIRAAEQELFDSFSDIEVELRSALAGESTCAAEVLLRATNTGPIDLGGDHPVAATHKRIEAEMVWVFDVRDDGLIVEERDYLDTAALMRQLGLD